MDLEGSEELLEVDLACGGERRGGLRGGRGQSGRRGCAGSPGRTQRVRLVRGGGRVVSGWYGAGDASCPLSAGRTVAVGVDGAEDGLEAVLAEPGAHGGAGEEELRERDEPVVVQVKRRKHLRGEEVRGPISTG